MSYLELNHWPTEESEIISLRVPLSLLNNYNLISNETKFSRNALIIDAMDKYIKKVLKGRSKYMDKK